MSALVAWASHCTEVWLCVHEADLFYKGLVQVVRAANAKIDHVHFCCHGVVEGVQKPGRIGHLCMLGISIISADRLSYRLSDPCAIPQQGKMTACLMLVGGSCQGARIQGLGQHMAHIM